MKKSDKKASHVGMILSFVIFVTFLVFIYSTLQPATQTQRDKEALLEYLKVELINDLSAELITLTISHNYETSEDNCLRVDVSELEVEGFNYIVKDDAGEIVDSDFSGNFVSIDLIEGDNFFNIYLSEEELLNEQIDLEGCVESEIALTKVKNYIFETKIMKMIVEYEDEYSVLKSELNIPESTEFWFSFEDSDGQEISPDEEMKEVSTNIYAEQIPIQYINSTASILSGFVNLKVW